MKKTIKFLLVIVAIINGKNFYAQSCSIDAGNNQVICCPGGSVLLVATSSVSNCSCPNPTYQWTPTVGLSSPTNDSTYASPSTSTWYYVCVTYYKRFCSNVCCQSCDSVLVTVNNSCCRLKTSESAGSVKELPNVNVYPNPAKTQLNIEIKQPEGIIEFELYDVTGKVVWKDISSAEKSKFTIDVSHLPRGFYFVKATDQIKGIYSGKLVLE